VEGAEQLAADVMGAPKPDGQPKEAWTEPSNETRKNKRNGIPL